ncbi:MAG: putative sulfate transporter [bacterium]|nr:putative sulfate transporter [bacterium]
MAFLLSIPRWLPDYRFDLFRADMIAGITLAAYLIPASIGDASLADLPPERGLYACVLSGLVFWLFCSSKHTAVTVTSAISLLTGSTLGELSAGDPLRHAVLASCAALLVAVLAFVAWMMRAGVVVNFVSETVMVGFKAGVAFHLSITQLPKIFGFKGGHGDFWDRLRDFITHLGETRSWPLILGFGALTLLIMGKRYLKHKPVALFVMALGVVIASITNLSAQGVSLLGEVPKGLPQVGIPMVSRNDLNELLPLAMACFLLGAVESAAIGRMFAQRHGYRFDTNQELLALAGSNLFAGLGQGYPVSGGMSQSLVNESAGARTPISGLMASIIVLIVVVFFTGLFRNLPQPVLGAIVLVAVTGLVDIAAFKRIWRFSRGEFAVALVALLGVLGSGLLRGVLVGAVLSLVLLLRRAARPNVTELGRVPGTEYYADVLRHPKNERHPEVLVFRCEASLLYLNVEHIRDRFEDLLNQRGEEIRLVVFFLGSVPSVDLAGAELLEEMRERLHCRGIEFRLAEAHGPVREALRQSGFERNYGSIEPNETVATVLKRWCPPE